MFNLRKYFKTNKELRKNLKIAEEKAKNFQNVCHQMLDKSTPEIVIEKILNEPVKWYDPTKLTKDEQIGYYNEAQAILRSPVYKNEKKAFTTDLINHIAIKSPNHDITTALRYSINGVQTLWERFGKIKNPETEPKESENPHAPI